MKRSCNPMCIDCSSDFSPEPTGELEVSIGNDGQEKIKIAYEKGETIFREGSKPSGVFCLNRGKVKVHKTGSHKQEQIIRFAIAKPWNIWPIPRAINTCKGLYLRCNSDHA